jgi:hypothetical protein
LSCPHFLYTSLSERPITYRYCPSVQWRVVSLLPSYIVSHPRPVGPQTVHPNTLRATEDSLVESCNLKVIWGWRSSVMGCGLNGQRDQGSIPGRAKKNFLFSSVQMGTGFHAASYTIGTEGSFPAVKCPACEVDHSSPSCTKVKNSGARPPLHHTS